jgi:hypothetical protein
VVVGKVVDSVVVGKVVDSVVVGKVVDSVVVGKVVDSVVVGKVVDSVVDICQHVCDFNETTKMEENMSNGWIYGRFDHMENVQVHSCHDKYGVESCCCSS